MKELPGFREWMEDYDPLWCSHEPEQDYAVWCIENGGYYKRGIAKTSVKVVKAAKKIVLDGYNWFFD